MVFLNNGSVGGVDSHAVCAVGDPSGLLDVFCFADLEQRETVHARHPRAGIICHRSLAGTIACRVFSIGLFAGFTKTGGESVFASAGTTLPSFRSKNLKGSVFDQTIFPRLISPDLPPGSEFR